MRGGEETGRQQRGEWRGGREGAGERGKREWRQAEAGRGRWKGEEVWGRIIEERGTEVEGDNKGKIKP